MALPAVTLVGDRYRIREHLGAGGMGRVWLAHDDVLNRDVALKEIVPPPGLAEPDRKRLRDRAMREARAIARLNNPNVVKIFDVIRTDADPWIVMEYLPSRSLQQVIDAEGRLPPARVAAIGLGVLDGLSAVHAAGVVHRDVKPANVLVGTDGRVVLTDFGLATIPGEASITQSGPAFMSPAFVAPERARHGVTDAASDLWSLGATLYAAVEGHSPFDRPSSIEVLAALISEPVPVPVAAGSLTPVLDGLLRKDPATRISASRARELLLAAAATPAPVPRVAARPAAAVDATKVEVPAAAVVRGMAPAPRSVPARPVTRRPPRGFAILAALAALVVVAVVVATWYAMSPTHDTTGSPPRPSTATTPAHSAPAQPATSQPATSAAPTSSQATSTPSSATGLVLPAGWRMYHDPTGFSIAAPIGWTMSHDGSILYFREPGGEHRVLGIDQSRHPKSDPVADWQHQEAVRLAGHDWQDYQRIDIVAVPYFVKGADWDFTYASGGSRIRVRNRGFVTSSTQAYAIYWSTPENDWDANYPLFQVIAASFQPRT